MIHKARFLVAVATLLGASAVFSATVSSKWKEVAPQNSPAVSIESKKGAQSYYFFDTKTILKVSVTGPGTLRVITRKVLAALKKESIYGFAVTRDGADRTLESATTKRSFANVAGDSKIRIGLPQGVNLDVPAGAHEYQFSLPADAKRGCYARFEFSDAKLRKPSGKAISYIAFLPRRFSEEVKIVIKEQEYTYYRASSDKPVELEVIGPTKIKGVARLEFNHTMRGDKPYRIQITEDDKVIQTSPFTGKISASATYSKTSDKVLGRGDAFYINVPDGKHHYQITTPDNGNDVLLHFYLPQKDLGNEWKPLKDGSAGLFAAPRRPSKG
jgi:hypothetical protein